MQTIPHIEGKLPPQAIELEKGVLGALLLERDSHDLVIPFLPSDVFYKREHELIFLSIKNLYQANKAIDLLTVTDQLKKTGNLEFVGGAYAVAKLTDGISSSANVEEYMILLKEAWMKREIISISHKSIEQAYQPQTDVFDALSFIKRGIDGIDQAIVQHKKSKEFSDIINGAVELMKVREERAKTGQITGKPTGLKALDRHIGGWQSPELTILAGRPGMGKTAFALHTAKAVAKSGEHVCIFSLEMKDSSMADRLILSETNVDPWKYRNGKMEAHDWEEVNIACTRLKPLPIEIIDNAVSSNFICSMSRILRRKGKCDMIIVDYLQLMEGDARAGNREQEISKISRSLKLLTKELDVPIIALSALSRSVETRGGARRPQLSDLRESGAIEQDADNVIFIHRDAYYGIEDETGEDLNDKGELILAKGRNIELVDIPFQHNPSLTKFWDLGDSSFAGAMQSMQANKSFFSNGGQ